MLSFSGKKEEVSMDDERKKKSIAVQSIDVWYSWYGFNLRNDVCVK